MENAALPVLPLPVLPLPVLPLPVLPISSPFFSPILKRGENSIAIAVDRKGPFTPSQSVKVEKVELHLK